MAACATTGSRRPQTPPWSMLDEAENRTGDTSLAISEQCYPATGKLGPAADINFIEQFMAPHGSFLPHDARRTHLEVRWNSQTQRRAPRMAQAHRHDIGFIDGLGTRIPGRFGWHERWRRRPLARPQMDDERRVTRADFIAWRRNEQRAGTRRLLGSIPGFCAWATDPPDGAHEVVERDRRPGWQEGPTCKCPIVGARRGGLRCGPHALA
jgi:hypothetical protein